MFFQVVSTKVYSSKKNLSADKLGGQPRTWLTKKEGPCGPSKVCLHKEVFSSHFTYKEKTSHKTGNKSRLDNIVFSLPPLFSYQLDK